MGSVYQWLNMFLLQKHKNGIVESGAFEPLHDKTNKMTLHPAKTQISLGIRPVWSDFAVRLTSS